MSRFTDSVGRTVAVVAVVVLTTLTIPTAARADTGIARIVKTDGTTPLNSGRSGTNFAIGLPSGAACPGDTAHHDYIVTSYVLRKGTALDRVRFAGGFPIGGTTIVTPDATPYEAQNTAEDTGQIVGLPIFSWAPYAHQERILPPGTYDVGIVCLNKYAHPARNWNAEIVFTASAHDPGGFVWSVAGAVKPAGSSSATGLIIAVIIGAGVVLTGAAIFLLRRRTRSTRPVARVS
jgi:hypothetical protein